MLANRIPTVIFMGGGTLGVAHEVWSVHSIEFSIDMFF